jgi:TP901 family phage tail tape measure protein
MGFGSESAGGDLIHIRMRLTGGSQVAAESKAAAAGIGSVGRASTASAAATRRGGGAIRNSIRSVLSNSMKLRAVGRTMTYGLTLPILGAGFMAIKTAAEFDTSMAQVGVATGQAGGELDSMRALAMKMGADTIFSANEAAQAMLELAKGGMSAAQIQAGALEASMNLAAAGGIELADAGNQITRSMNTFQIPAERSAEIANALAGGANKSSADINDLSLALSQSGQAAVSSGFSLNETVGALAAFADAGVIGSDAGTSLKVMLQRLVPQSDEAKGMMAQMGMEFFDAHGNMKSLAGITGELEQGFKGLTQEQRAEAMQTIFGSDASRAANILLTQGKKGILDYIDATKDQTAAEKMADARMQGLSGALETLKGSLETAALTLGIALKPAIIAVAGVLTKLANAFTALPPEAQTAIAVLLVMLAFLGPMIFLLGTAAAAATALGITLGALLIGIGIGAAIVIAIAAIAVGFLILYNKVQWFHNAVDAVVGFFKSQWQLIASLLLLPFLPIAIAGAIIATVIRAVIGHIGGLKGVIVGAFNVIKIAFAVLKWQITTWGKILFYPIIAAIQLLRPHFAAIRAFIGGVFNWIKGAAGTVAGAISGAFSSVAGTVSGVFRSIVSGVISAINWLIRAFNSAFDRTIDPPGPGPSFEGIHIDEIGGGPASGAAANQEIQSQRKAGRNFQHGGIVPTSGLIRVGEQGEELARLPGGTRIYPHTRSKSIARELGSIPLTAPAPGGGGGELRPIQLIVNGRKLAEVTVEAQQNAGARS